MAPQQNQPQPKAVSRNGHGLAAGKAKSQLAGKSKGLSIKRNKSEHDVDADADVSSSEDVLAPGMTGGAPRKTASGIKATSKIIKVDVESDGELSDPDERGTLYLRTRAQTRHVHAKPKRVPIHMQWSEDSGSESDPDIIAPGWNLPQQRSRAKAKEESESEVDLARTNKGSAPVGGRPRTLGGSRRN